MAVEHCRLWPGCGHWLWDALVTAGRAGRDDRADGGGIGVSLERTIDLQIPVLLLYVLCNIDLVHLVVYA